jgi:hypothetical protein
LGPYTHQFLQSGRELLFNTDEDLIDCMTSTTRLIVIIIATLSLFIPTISMLDQITSFQIQEEYVQILYPLKVAFVFASGEAQLRCTDGKLASSQDQCPATDRCPPSENNTVSNCVSEASANSTLQNTEIQNTTNDETTAEEGQLRCTDGKLASSQDQCPATDRCPPSENNTVSNCVSEASANSTLQNTEIQNTTNDETTAPPSCLDNRFTLHTPQCADSSSSSENDTSTS